MLVLKRLPLVIEHSAKCAWNRQTALQYSMLDKLPTVNTEPIVVEDEPIKKERSSKAMRAHLHSANEYRKLIEAEKEEFHVGKRHLANMMGCDPETFTQQDVDEAIEYLFPCGVFEKKARPMMKPPEVLYPPKKEAEFDDTGRPFHFLFYTAKSYFYQILHDAVKHLNELNQLEDDVISGKRKEEPPPPLETAGTKWISVDTLIERTFAKRLSKKEYSKFVGVMERLADHPYAYKCKDFIMKHREILSQSVFIPPAEPIQHTEDGREFVRIERIHKKCAFADVTVYRPGTGKVTVNGTEFLKYFPDTKEREQVLFPLVFTDMVNKVDIEATVDGAGSMAHAVAIRIGTSMCLKSFVDEHMLDKMRLAGLLQKDPRLRERKIPGHWGARRAFTWRKR